MNDIFVRLLFGHLFGDYMFQGKTMAIRKSEKGPVGLLWCLLHCTIYTASVCIFIQRCEWYVVLGVFATHFPIDRWSLASKWLKLIRGRDFVAAYEGSAKYREIDIAFSTLVYAVGDNTMHLFLLWVITKHA